MCGTVSIKLKVKIRNKEGYNRHYTENWVTKQASVGYKMTK